MAKETTNQNWFEEGDIESMYDPEITTLDVDQINDPDTYVKGGSKDIEDEYFASITGDVSEEELDEGYDDEAAAAARWPF